MRSTKELKIAIVHDYLQWYGGAEKVVETLHEMFPSAPIFTSVYNEETMPEEYKGRDIRTSFMQSLPFWGRFLKHYSFLYPMAFEQFDFSEFDVVISSSNGFAKGIITKPETFHIAYTHTPPRFQWGYQTTTRDKLNALYRNFILPPIDNYLRIWDQAAAKRVDLFVANSEEVKRRIKKFYRRDAIVVNPPIQTSLFAKISKGVDSGGDYFVIVARLERYKRVDVVIEACNELNLNLKIIGTGADEEFLKSLAGRNIEFLGRVSDEKLRETVAGSKGFIFMTEEDFGMAMVEALSAGVPVIAYAKGGALEIVQDGVNGIFVQEQNKESLISALQNFEDSHFEKSVCQKSSLKFDVEVFKNKLINTIEEEYNKYISALSILK